LSPIAALEDDFDITIENEILDPTATAGRWRLIEFTGEAAPCSFAGAAGKLRLFCAEDIGIADGESDGGPSHSARIRIRGARGWGSAAITTKEDPFDPSAFGENSHLIRILS
jgi:hypothetical protein